MLDSSQGLTRRAFIKSAGLTLTGFLLNACGGERVQVTATLPQPTGTSPAGATGSDAGLLADTVLTRCRALTMDATGSIAESIALRGDRILAVGGEQEMGGIIGPATEVIDVRGKTVLPGFIDAHNHLQVWGNIINEFEPLLPPEVRTREALVGRLGEIVAGAPAGEWVQGYFWIIDVPDRHEIDSVAPDNPVWLLHQGGHFGTCNTLALQIAGITAETPDPVGGVIERDADGVPTGRVYNHRAMDMVRRFAPQPTEEMILANIRMAEGRFAAVGVTTYQDCNARYQALQAYFEAGRSQSMMLRSDIYYTVEWQADLERALGIEPITGDHLRFLGFKFLIDGQFPTWYTREPHEGISWNMTTWDQGAFKDAVRALHETGLQVAVHCGGDASVDLALDAFEAAMNADPRPDPRHRIEHATLCASDAVGRIADLGVVISTQPQFIRFSQDLPGKLGEERAGRIMVTRDWLDAGITVALGSDTPSTPWYEPQVTLVGAILRPDAAGNPFHPEQAMTIEEALLAHTMGAAKAGHEEADRGSIEPGKFADLVVWNEDLTDLDPPGILNATVDTTYVGGEVVYQAG